MVNQTLAHPGKPSSRSDADSFAEYSSISVTSGSSKLLRRATPASRRISYFRGQKVACSNFLPCLAHAGLRRFRFHDLRHTFGSLLIQNGASLAYVKEQMGHSSIQVTVDIYGHLIPGANVSWVDSLDARTSPQQSATPAQLDEETIAAELPEVSENVGGGGWTRTKSRDVESVTYRN